MTLLKLLSEHDVYFIRSIVFSGLKIFTCVQEYFDTLPAKSGTKTKTFLSLQICKVCVSLKIEIFVKQVQNVTK